MSRDPSARDQGVYDEVLPKLFGKQPLTERERLAVEFGVRMATCHTTIDDAFVSELRTQFNETELVELGMCTAVFIGFGRLNNVLGVPPRGV